MTPERDGKLKAAGQDEAKGTKGIGNTPFNSLSPYLPTIVPNDQRSMWND